MFDFLRNLTKSAEEKRHEAVTAYLDNTLSPREREQFATQLAQDPNLQAEVEQVRAVKQSLQQLPQRRVPKNFTLDPALYGRPAKQPLIQAYPVLRAATGLAAVFFIFALFAGYYVGGGTSSEDSIANAPFAGAAEEADSMNTAVQQETEPEGANLVEEVAPAAEIAESAMEEESAPMEEAAPVAEAPMEEPVAPMPAASATQAPSPENDALESETATDGEEGTLTPATPTITATLTAVPTATTSQLPLTTATLEVTDRAVNATKIADQVVLVTSAPSPVEAIQATAVPEAREAQQPLNTLLILQIGLLLLLLILGVITLYARRQF